MVGTQTLEKHKINLNAAYEYIHIIKSIFYTCTGKISTQFRILAPSGEREDGVAGGSQGASFVFVMFYFLR